MMAITPEPPSLLPELQFELRRLTKRVDELNIAISALISAQSIPLVNMMAKINQHDLQSIANGLIGKPPDYLQQAMCGNTPSNGQWSHQLPSGKTLYGGTSSQTNTPPHVDTQFITGMQVR